MKNKLFKTIESQVTLILVGFVILLISLASYTFYQNYKIKQVNRITGLCYQLQVNTFVHVKDLLTFQNAINENISSLDTTGSYAFLKMTDNIVDERIKTMFDDNFDSVKVSKDRLNTDELRGIWKELKKVTETTLEKIQKSKSDTLNRNIARKISVEYKVETKKVIGEFYTFIFRKMLDKSIMPTLIANRENGNERARKVLILIMALTFITIIFCVYAWFSFRKSLRESIRKPKEMLEKLSVGQLPDTESLTLNELRVIIDASNKLTKGLKKSSEFAKEIGDGNFEMDYEPLSENDILGNALVGMRDNLKKYTLNERLQSWSNTGYTRISDILRNSNNNKEITSTEVLITLIKYLDANQGAIFIYDEVDKQLEMLSAYAYDRKKYIKKTLKPGEGLAGQVLLEGETVYLKEVPEDYIQIRSGLGGASPKNILIVPLKNEKGIEGVLELASFKIFEPYMIELVEKIALNIAVTFANSKNVEKTNQLLQDTTEMTQIMKAQDEEMRQSMEELHTTQEESKRREKEYLKEIENLKNENKKMKENNYNLTE